MRIGIDGIFSRRGVPRVLALFLSAGLGAPLMAQTAQFTLGRNVFVPAKDGTVTTTFTASYSGKTTLSIYNSAGELVRVLFPTAVVPASMLNSLTWDGKNTSGKVVAPGIYIFHLALILGSYDKRLVVLD